METTLNTKDGFVLLRKYRNCLMGFAALCILAFHTWTKMFQSTDFWFVEIYIAQIVFFGVDIFFFLSGFGLYFSIQSHSVSKFYGHRFRRLAIPVLTVALLYYVRDGWNIWQLLGNISGVNFYLKNMYSFLWFVPAIATFYLLFPIYYKLFSASSNKVAFTLCILVLWLLSSIALRDTPRSDLYGFTNRIPIFCAGCLAGYLSQQKTHIFNRSIWILLVLTLILGIYLGYLTNYQDMPLLVPSPNCCVPTFLMAVSVSFLIPKGLDLLRSIPILRLMESALVRFLTLLGTISFELYCIQEWLFSLIRPLIIDRFHVLMVNVIFFICVTVMGIILWLMQNAIWKLAAKLLLILRK